MEVLSTRSEGQGAYPVCITDLLVTPSGVEPHNFSCHGSVVVSLDTSAVLCVFATTYRIISVFLLSVKYFISQRREDPVRDS